MDGRKRIEEKLGIATRHVAAPDECASDLGVRAAERLFDSGVCQREDIDYLLFCTQSPDYRLPTTACLMQNRLGLRTSIGALDFNLGCSGFVYGLGLAKGLIETGQAKNVLLITAETYSKYMHPSDKSVRTLFGDAGAATLVSDISEGHPNDGECLGPFLFGTDGTGGDRLIVGSGGARNPRSANEGKATDASCREGNLFMDGPAIFTFTLSTVSRSIQELLKRADCTPDDVDLFVFHQASKHMLDTLRKKCAIPEERFVRSMRDCGNTVSSTIPIALKEAQCGGRLKAGSTVMIVGFGVGLSWATGMLRWL